MFIVNPVTKYFINGDTCKLLSVQLITVASTNNVAVAAVAAVAGVSPAKKIRVMGFSFTANAAGTNPGIILKDGSGGTTLYAVTIPALTVGEHARPVIDSGYLETTVGVGLYYDVLTSAANLFINYIIYTP